ncbi:MAG TPA: DUF6569 family protein [Acidobacteriaceae bacterium]|nr:DUF6569 family protein [Acidobacteriaceae bacterium]
MPSIPGSRRYGVALFASILALAAAPIAVHAGETSPYRVLPPIQRGNLTIFPLVANHSFDTSQLLTLDEGIRTGQVVVTEEGQERGLVRPGQAIPPRTGPQVNRLVLYNNSSRPLLLLAGEIVTGGHQDRVVGADSIVPPQTGPIDLGVFCVEPGRWTGASPKFGAVATPMAQPSVRMPAMVDRNQGEVWDHVAKARASMANQLNAPEAAAVAGTTSYAQAFQSAPVEKRIEQYGGLENEQVILRELRKQGATGVVVAVGGNILWADVFASTDLLARYWPKLIRSYVAEAMTNGGATTAPDLHQAESWIQELSGGREVVETVPGVYRRVDVTGEGYKVLTLHSLLPGESFDVHLTKISG